MAHEHAAGALFRYRAFGLVVHANVPVAGLAIDRDPVHTPAVTLTVHYGAALHVPAAREILLENGARHASGRSMLRISRLPGGGDHVLEHGSGLVCRIDAHGRTISVGWPERLTEDPWEFILGFAFAYLLYLRGTVCLHGAVVVGREALFLVGPPGSGKSTLAAGLALRGWSLLTDDTAALIQDDAVSVCPGPATLRPRQPAIAALQALTAGRVVWSPSAESGCIDIDPIAAGVFHGGSATRVGRVTFLAPMSGNRPVTIEPVPPAEAVVGLIGRSWMARVTDPHHRTRELAIATALTAQARVERLSFSVDDSGWLTEAIDRILGSELAYEPSHHRRVS
jgi:hypothetical protein